MTNPTDDAEQASLPHFYFKHRGKRYKCFKREKDRNAPYYIKVNRRKVSYKRCLETNVQDQAELAAKDLIDLILDDRIAELNAKKLRGAETNVVRSTDAATLGEVAAAYREKAAVFVRPRTINDNINALRLVGRCGLGKPDLDAARVDALRTTVLTGALVSRFEDARLRAAGAAEEKRQSALVSINAYMRQARSIFTDKLRKIYGRDFKLVLPDLKDFLEEELAAPARLVKEAAPAELIANTFAEARVLKTADTPAYIAFLLGVCSLRRGEIQRAEWSWVLSEQGVIRVPRQSKSKVIRLVPVPAAVMAELDWYRATVRDREEWDREHVLPTVLHGQGGQHAKHRAQSITERVDKWMREIGWDRTRYRHTLHELRAYYLRELRKAHGLEIAGEVAGHSDLRVTRQHYTGVLDVSTVKLQLPLGGEVNTPSEMVS